MSNGKQLRRSVDNKVIGGVCGGVADYMSLSATTVRILFALLVLCAGLSLWAYIIMWILIPAKS
ncbi:MAG: PspC domain-containing protein [Rikenellaceae bacterium]